MNSSNHKFSPLPLFFCALTALASATFAQSEDAAPDRDAGRTRFPGGGISGEVEPQADAATLSLTAELAGGFANVRASGGQAFGQALVLLGSGLRPVALAPIGVGGALVVSEVFAVVPIRFDAAGSAHWKFDLAGTNFAKHDISIYMQLLVIDVGHDGSLSGSTSNHLAFDFTGGGSGGGVQIGRPWVGPTSGISQIRTPRPAGIARLPLDQVLLPSRW